MCSKKFFGRLLPFFATFVVGILIASIFAPFGRSSMGGRRHRHFEEDRQMRLENEQLREENLRLKEQLNDSLMNVQDSDFSVPVPPPLPVKPHIYISPKGIK